MIFKQYYLACLSHASYLIGDEATRTAVVVDPQRDIEQYLADARAQGLTIRHVFLTHFHADFVAGHLELARATGAAIRLGARARAEYAHTPMAEGEELVLGQVKLRVLETPGHTPEGISILVFDLQRDARQPQAVLTGDTLFVGDVGRPDLMASVGITAEELAGMLYDSLHQKLLKLPDATKVYPAHGAGSMCGRSLSTETSCTIGKQRATNYMLQPMSRAQFIAAATAELPKAPAYFGYDAEINKRDHELLEVSLKRSLKGLSLEALLELQHKGALVLDVRDPAEYEPAHLAGSLNIGLGGKYATWAGTLLDPARPIVLIAPVLREQEAAMRLGRIGFDHVVGFLSGGPAAFLGRKELVRSIERVEPLALLQRLTSKERELVLDVRGANEWADYRIEGSLNIPLPELERRIAEVPHGKRIAVHCLSGYRSSIAGGILERHGFSGFTDLVGGISAWRVAGLPTSTSAATAR